MLFRSDDGRHAAADTADAATDDDGGHAAAAAAAAAIRDDATSGATVWHDAARDAGAAKSHCSVHVAGQWLGAMHPARDRKPCS